MSELADVSLSSARAEGMVSVILPSYKSMKTIGRAIDSVVAQTYPNWELIIADDASPDGAADWIARRIKGEGARMTLIRLSENGGPSRARNKAITASRGEWVAVLDADDMWMPDRLALLLQRAAETSADAVCDNLMGYDDHLASETGPLFDHLPERLGIVDIAAPTFGGSYDLGYLKPIIRRSFLLAHGIAYDETLRSGEDLHYLLNLVVRGAVVACLEQSTYLYTTPVGVLSGRLSKSTNTVPRNLQLAASVRAVREAGASILSEAETDALDKRILLLEESAPLSEFRHARLDGNWLRVLALVMTSHAVRRKIVITVLKGR